MLRRNLMLIALAIFIIGLTSHAFGQGRATGRHTHQPKRIVSPRDTGAGQTTGKETKIYGDVHPGEGDIGSGMVRNQPQTTRTNRRTRNPKPFFRPNPAGDGTTQQVVTKKPPQAQNENKLGNFEIQGVKTPNRTTQIQPGQNSGGTISNQVREGKPNQQTRRGKRQHKP